MPSGTIGAALALTAISVVEQATARDLSSRLAASGQSAYGREATESGHRNLQSGCIQARSAAIAIPKRRRFLASLSAGYR